MSLDRQGLGSNVGQPSHVQVTGLVDKTSLMELACLLDKTSLMELASLLDTASPVQLTVLCTSCYTQKPGEVGQPVTRLYVGN